MEKLTSEGQQKINELAQHHGVSVDAVMSILWSLRRSNGTMAQFDHPDLGGQGQWMRGGMTMVGDMFNHALKTKVDAMCSELASLVVEQPLAPRGQRQAQSQTAGPAVALFETSLQDAGGRWWPAELGIPSTTGSQNNVRYAYFAEARRLAVDSGGRVTVYDTLDHRIGGVSQQQGGSTSVTFTSQHGTVDLANLPVVSGVDVGSGTAQKAHKSPQTGLDTPASGQETDIFSKIERLAELKQKGILSEEEFAAKKAELLKRL